MTTNFSPLRAIPDDPFTIVKAGRAVLKARQGELADWVKNERQGRPFQSASEKTLVQYERDVKRMMVGGANPWIAAADTEKRSTWLKRKSAILSVAEKNLQVFLAAQDKLQRKKPEPGSADFQAWIKSLKAVHYWTAVLESRPAVGAHVLDQVQPRKSKRAGLSKLPDDWREQVVGRMKKWKHQALLCAVTGCRPIEIAAGIELIVKNGQMLTKVEGAKCGPSSGQEWRAMLWDLKDAPPLVRELAELVQAAGGTKKISYEGLGYPTGEAAAKALSGAMRQASKRAFGESVSLTPYSMRHALASDLKASNLPADKVSQALGHQAIETQKTYGHHKQARGASVPKKVSAARKVRGGQSSPPAKKAANLSSGKKMRPK